MVDIDNLELSASSTFYYIIFSKDEVDVPMFVDGYLFCGSKNNAELLIKNHKAQM